MIVNGWEIEKELVEPSSIFEYHKLLRTGKLSVAKCEHGHVRFSYRGWVFIKVYEYSKCIIPFDFDFSGWDFYSCDSPNWLHAEHLKNLKKHIPQARYLGEHEVNMMHKYFPSTAGKCLITDFNYKESVGNRLLTYIVDTDKEEI